MVWIGVSDGMGYSLSALVAGGFRVAQFVRIEREPSHWPFIAVMAVSASCNEPN